MTARQHSGIQLSIRRENPHGDGNTNAAREGADMAVWFMHRLQCLPREQFTLFHAEIANGAENVGTPQMIVETTCCARENVRMR